ncbi:hypothetical protein [Cryobacterium roopkundense]|uniref:Uncharacterized protein n=1 Tax=Cryobacterium roopkundense TaxID=1001240 RepID=A0A7W8ZVJ5_9MICO|nr:hypothetical protein [Cryobacterium roopkundense]MBB5640727.1 hypothetical protein [Cryobacterium roopkundense]
MRRIIWKRSTLLWLLALAIMAGFQWWRGARIDGVLFTVAVILVVVDLVKGSLVEPFIRRHTVPRGVILACAALVGVTLVVTPRNGWLALAGVIIAGAGVTLLAWDPQRVRDVRPDTAVRRSSTIWALLAISLCVWEALALVISATSPLAATIALQAFPTVSVLLDPFLQSWVGQTFFVGCWMLAGLGLLRLWSRP